VTNRALLVGINAYPSYPLRGCINDVNDIAKLLVEKCLFHQTEIRFLTEGQATASAIRDTLSSWLVQAASSGDRLLFHFSGHGSILPGQDGKVHNVICPVDFDFTEEHALSNLDFERIFAPLSEGVEFNWVSDSCHSGNLARRLAPGYMAPRYLPPPPAIMAKIEALRAREITTRSLSRAMDHLNGAFISGCQTEETSADAIFGDRYNGALTYYLLQELEAPAGLEQNLTSIIGNVGGALRSNGYSQHPQLHGSPEICAKPFLADPVATAGT
jgi:hypothetical protein